MCCLFLAAFGIGPRFALLLWWVFGDRVSFAFDSWVWPLLGLLLAPWTTLFYLLTWSAVGGVSGWDWLFIGFGVLLDVASYSSKYVKAQYDGRYGTSARGLAPARSRSRADRQGQYASPAYSERGNQ